MFSLGILEIAILAAGGLLCLGLPLGIIAAVMAVNRRREE